MAAPAISLRFGDAVPDLVRRRIEHGFRSYCALYALQPSAGGVRLVYGAPGSPDELELTASYAARTGFRRSDPPISYRRPGLFADEEAEEFPCFHPPPQARPPDWLGEIFEWLGGEAERLTDAADSVGRIPYHKTLHGLHALDPEVPYAAAAMRGLNQDIARVAGSAWPDRPAPLDGIDGTTLVATHDLDFLPVSAPGAVARGAKNAAIAALVHRDPGLALQIAVAAGRGAFQGRSPLDTLGAMEERERVRGVVSSSYVICVRRHRRDANYRLDQVRADLTRLAAAGMEIGVHGSYTSLATPGGLAEEYELLRRAGFRPRGGRQHWLRYRGADLFDALVAAGAQYDSTVGHPRRIGFRAGACFPYVPWNFAAEAPYPLLEIPLAVMDVTLYTQFGRDLATAERRTRSLLRRTARYGWGGISVLWHNTVFGGAQLPMPLSELYWRLPEAGQVWTAGAALTERAAPRFARAGFPGIGR